MHTQGQCVLCRFWKAESRAAPLCTEPHAKSGAAERAAPAAALPVPEAGLYRIAGLGAEKDEGKKKVCLSLLPCSKLLCFSALNCGFLLSLARLLACSPEVRKQVLVPHRFACISHSRNISLLS